MIYSNWSIMPIIVSVSGHSLPWGQKDIVPYFICTYDFCLHRDEDKGDDVDGSSSDMAER